MSLPLPDLTFYRMPDFNSADATGVGLLDAINNSIISAVDYRGVSLPSSHIWTVASSSTAPTNKCYSYIAPTASGINANFSILIAASDVIVAPTMLSPDTYSINNILLGMNKDGGAMTTWTNTLPMTVGSFSGFVALTPLSAKATTTRARVYISQEAIFINIFTDLATPFWAYVGAMIEPINSYSDTKHNYIPCAESDDRIYGMTSSGTSTVSPSFLSTSPTLFAHSVTGFQNHFYIFQPNSSSILNNMRRRTMATGQYNTNEERDLSGNFVLDNFEIVRNTFYRIGNTRGIFAFGVPRAGQFVIREGSVDKYHLILEDQTGANATQAFALNAVS
jgi:hypothetical protein